MEKKHMTLQDRLRIEQMLNEKKTFTEIARILEKDKCTISKEIRAHVKYFRVGGQGINYNSCRNRYNCQKTRICSNCISPKKYESVSLTPYTIFKPQQSLYTKHP